ncbi:MAG: acetoacetate--CoA ligase [Hyphomicrobiales bacterium]|nr:MAG: acetoacetate--CoA ligase [Hyphomicrobiales bacterium]
MDPARQRATLLWQFTELTSASHGCAPDDYWGLHRWSIAERGAFWSAVWDFCGVIGDKGERLVIDGELMPGARFLPDATLNFAENLLRRDGPTDAIVFRDEAGARRRWSWDELRQMVSRLQQALLGLGIGAGDRVAGMLPNLPETVAMMLATASIGAVWSSCSPDFGPRGVLDRFSQIAPKLFVTVDGYHYNGKLIDIGATIAEVAGALAPARTVVIDVLGRAAQSAGRIDGAVTMEAFLAPFSVEPVRFARLPFSHPLFILFSSGTTGKPKCIVHSAGGTLLQHLKEHRLHCDVHEGDRVFYFTTCGWMMWNWLASALGCGATLCLYDGSPFHPEPTQLFDYAEAERFTLFGTSARYLDSVRKLALKPIETHDLKSVRAILSTGSPLAADCFDYVYSNIKGDVHLASISGGTDIVSSFVLGVPTLPVWRGEIQAPGLGLAVDVFDEDGQPMRQGKGELVCRAPFPSMPIGFWNDPDGSRYRAAYFSRFDGVWAHGDYAEWTAHHGIMIHGRSDATLNPGGVRIGTAEIYAVVEELPEIDSALCIGQQWENDTRVVLFIKLAPGAALDEALRLRIRSTIRSGASPRHVPAKVIAVADLPRTRSGKLTELAVRDVVHGRPVRNVEGLANPEALKLFENLAELTT